MLQKRLFLISKSVVRSLKVECKGTFYSLSLYRENKTDDRIFKLISTSRIQDKLFKWTSAINDELKS